MKYVNWCPRESHPIVKQCMIHRNVYEGRSRLRVPVLSFPYNVSGTSRRHCILCHYTDSVCAKRTLAKCFARCLQISSFLNLNEVDSFIHSTSSWTSNSTSWHSENADDCLSTSPLILTRSHLWLLITLNGVAKAQWARTRQMERGA